MRVAGAQAGTLTKVALYLVRHAKAGERKSWHGDDRLRPLSKKGRAQAHWLTDLLADHRIPGIISSPYVRCVQTVEPLAAKLGLEVQVTEALAEEQPFGPAVELLLSVADHTVLCSHGDVIPATIDALIERGMHVRGQPDWRKGSVWVLHRDGNRIRRGHAIPPPG